MNVNSRKELDYIKADIAKIKERLDSQPPKTEFRELTDFPSLGLLIHTFLTYKFDSLCLTLTDEQWEEAMLTMNTCRKQLRECYRPGSIQEIINDMFNAYIKAQKHIKDFIINLRCRR